MHSGALRGKVGRKVLKTNFVGTAPMHLQEQITWEKKLYDTFLLSLQLIQNWLFGSQILLKYHKVVVTEEMATILMEHLLQNDSDV